MCALTRLEDMAAYMGGEVAEKLGAEAMANNMHLRVVSVTGGEFARIRSRISNGPASDRRATAYFM